MNINLRTKAKNDFEKDFFKLINNPVFRKTMENVRNHRDTKLVKTENRRNKLLLEHNYHTTKHFSEKPLAIEMNKTSIKMKKPIYLGLLILDMRKIAMYDEYWYDCVKLKYEKKSKLCKRDRDSFIVHVKSDNIYADLAGDVKQESDKSNCEVKKPLPIGKKKQKTGLMKDKLGGKKNEIICSPET